MTMAEPGRFRMKIPDGDGLLMGRADIMRGVVGHAIGRTYRNYMYLVGLGAGKFLPISGIDKNPFDRNNIAEWDVHMLTGYESFNGHGIMEVFFDRNGLAAFRENYTFFYRSGLSERKIDAISEKWNHLPWDSSPLFLKDQVTEENAWRLLKSKSVEDRIAGVGMVSKMDDSRSVRDMIRFISHDEDLSVRRRLMDRLLRMAVPIDVYDRLMKEDPDELIREESASRLCCMCGGIEPFIETISKDPCPMTRASGLLLQGEYDNWSHIDHFVGDPDAFVRCAAARTWPRLMQDIDLMVELVNDDPLVFKYLCSRIYGEPGPYTWMMNEFMKRTKSEDIRAEAAMGMLGAWQ